MYPLAVHISDGVLSPSWQIFGFVVAAILLIINARGLTDDEIPRLALLSAAFFVASLIHVSVGVTSVHLLLNGLVGVVLGRRAVLAITVGLVLQAVLIGHGGYMSLGVNICTMTFPAFLASILFEGLRRLPAIQRPWPRGLLVAGCVILWAASLIVGLELVRAEWNGSDPMRHLIDQSAKGWTVVAAVVLLGILAAFWERRLGNSPDFAIGLLVGEVSVLAAVGLTALLLRLSLPSDVLSNNPLMVAGTPHSAALPTVPSPR
jgi:cobalt/nickel transport system permease protein